MGEISDKDVEDWFKKKFEDWADDGKKGCCKKSHKGKAYKTGAGAGGGIYCLGFIGAIVYYIGAATSFWVGVLGVLKSFVWQAFLVHGLMKYLGL